MMFTQRYPAMFLKNDWGAGPWLEEPDHVEWVDESTDLPCLARRGSSFSGSWCGYVAVRPGHPWFGKSYNDCTRMVPCSTDYCDHTPEHLISVHGGLTYSGQSQAGDEDGICHTRIVIHDDLFWFGFDCAHGGDYLPGMVAWERAKGIPWPGGYERVYRDLDYVLDECRDLARQLLAHR